MNPQILKLFLFVLMLSIVVGLSSAYSYTKKPLTASELATARAQLFAAFHG